MPIQFPSQRVRGFEERQWLRRRSMCFDAVPAANLGRVGYKFWTAKQGQQPNYSLDPGIGANPIRATNVRRMSTMYQDPAQTAIINAPHISDLACDAVAGFDRNLAEQNSVMQGISRDSAGAPLAGVDVQLFRSSDCSFVGQVTSDANGAWRLDGMSGGPFFIVEYLVGAPDVFGTSPNNLVETIVQGGT